jgi:hypothetical protein
MMVVELYSWTYVIVHRAVFGCYMICIVPAMVHCRTAQRFRQNESVYDLLKWCGVNSSSCVHVGLPGVNM